MVNVLCEKFPRFLRVYLLSLFFSISLPVIEKEKDANATCIAMMQTAAKANFFMWRDWNIWSKYRVFLNIPQFSSY